MLACSTKGISDVVLTSEELAPEIGDVPAEVIVIENFFDLDEIHKKLSAAVRYSLPVVPPPATPQDQPTFQQ